MGETKKRELPILTRAESELMRVLWDAGPVTVQALVGLLDRALAYNTVLTVTEILYRKGWLAREKHGRAYRYWPAASRDDYTARLMDEALDSATDRTAALVRFMEGMAPEEMLEIRRALDAAAEAEGR